MGSSNYKKRIAIIGAGVSGLPAIKNCIGGKHDSSLL